MKRKNKSNLVIGILVAAVVVLALSFVFFGGRSGVERETIAATGRASVDVMPDEANVFVRIETLSESADESKNENSKISDDVLYALYKIGIDKDDIGTEQFNIYPEYTWEDRKRELKGYKTINVLKVKTIDFGDVGKIVDAAVDAGANGIDRISFDLSEDKQTEMKKEALTKATKDARGKAEAIAQGLDAKLGKVVSISESSYGYMPYRFYEAEMGVAALEEKVETTILPKELEVTAVVNVVFKIK